jgi:hypothetical protein
MLFLIMLWLVSLASVAVYLITSPAKSWSTRLVFDVPVLAILVFVCFALQPAVPASAPDAAEAAQWRPYLSAIYIAAISVLLLGIAGTIRYFIFRRSA